MTATLTLLIDLNDDEMLQSESQTVANETGNI